MSFDTAWLDLREPADHAARDAGLLRAFAEAMPPSARIIDLGSGTGSTLRAIAPHLPDARWLLTDNDPALLAEARCRVPEIEVEQVDLSCGLPGLLSRDADAITASALIDLVSTAWVDELVAGVRGRVIYMALSYDGRDAWSPLHDSDAEIFAAFNRHQRGDKGFGPALGPDAVPYLSKALTEAGYIVQTADSPWILRENGPLMSELATGIARAATEAGVASEVAENWLCARKAAVRCETGHLDLFALPANHM